MITISSRHNPKVVEWRRLRRPDVARAGSRVLIEGVRAVLQSLSSRHRVEALIVCPEMVGPDVIQLLRRQAPAAVPVFALSPEAFASLSARDGPAGVAAVLDLRVGALASFGLGREDILVALWRVENPGNLGTVVRTADSFGVRAVVLVDRCTNPYAPAAAKASMGALFHMPLVACPSLGELRAWCARHGATLVGTSARGSIPSTAWAPRRPLVLLFGREGGGLTAEGVALCDYTVRIPLQGVNTSLNLATAAGILTYLVAGATSPRLAEGGV